MNFKAVPINPMFLAFGAALVLGGCFSINSDVEVADGETVERSLTTVNGAITVGVESTVRGDAETVNGAVSIGRGSSIDGEVGTVNGKIELAEDTRADAVSGVNGSISIGAGARVEGSVETVNGRIGLGADSVVGGSVESVNGQIRLEGASAGSLLNVNGGIVLEQGSRVLGELRIKKPRLGNNEEPVTVIIHADCEVVGPLVFERPVELRIHESATVGEIQGAEPEYFSD